jgi:uncharacterized protein YbjT (DUF2867 family)
MTKTRLLVLGGSGRTGVHVLLQAAKRGHHVRALVRDPAALGALDLPANVELIQGSPANIDDIRRAMDGAEAVIDVLNNSRASDNPWAKPVSPATFMADAVRNVLAVMGERGIARIVVTSSQGVGDDWPRLNPILRTLIRLSNIKLAFADHNEVDRLVRSSSTDWTLVRAVALTDKPAAGPTQAAEAGADKPGMWINRADLARFLLDAIASDTWIRKTPLVWNAKR